MSEQSPSFGIISQAVTDLSFENFVKYDFRPEDGVEPKMDIKVNVNTEKAKEDNVHNVALSLVVGAKAGEQSIFLLELTYTGIFVLENFSNNILEQVLNIECPRLLFPFARAIVASTVAAGNMPMPLLPPIDFADLYMRSKENTSK